MTPASRAPSWRHRATPQHQQKIKAVDSISTLKSGYIKKKQHEHRTINRQTAGAYHIRLSKMGSGMLKTTVICCRYIRKAAGNAANNMCRRCALNGLRGLSATNDIWDVCVRGASHNKKRGEHSWQT